MCFIRSRDRQEAVLGIEETVTILGEPQLALPLSRDRMIGVCHQIDGDLQEGWPYRFYKPRDFKMFRTPCPKNSLISATRTPARPKRRAPASSPIGI
jgi:hypothetical protein